MIADCHHLGGLIGIKSPATGCSDDQRATAFPVLPSRLLCRKVAPLGVHRLYSPTQAPTHPRGAGDIHPYVALETALYRNNCSSYTSHDLSAASLAEPAIHAWNPGIQSAQCACRSKANLWGLVSPWCLTDSPLNSPVIGILEDILYCGPFGGRVVHQALRLLSSIRCYLHYPPNASCEVVLPGDPLRIPLQWAGPMIVRSLGLAASRADR
jgi:hypothetical protein